MPNYKCHLVGSVFFYAVGLYCVLLLMPLTIAARIEMLLFTLAGALFPDIDTKSKGQKLFYWVILILAGVLLYAGHMQAVIVLAAVAILPLLVKHRGLFHKLWFVVLFAIGVALICCSYAPHCKRLIMLNTFFFILGVISHLWLDLGLRRMLRW